MQRLIRVAGVCVFVGAVGACGGDEQTGRVSEVALDQVDPSDAALEIIDAAPDVQSDVLGPQDEADSAASESEADVAPIEVEVEIISEVGPDVTPVDCGDCDDHLACTNDVCGADGICQHHVKAGMCRAGGSCYDDGEGPSPCVICAPALNPNGLTSLTGGPCDDGNPCTSDEQCTFGTCGGGSERACVASSACHVSLGCDKDAGCVEALLPEGTPCGAGRVCAADPASAAAEDGLSCVVGDGMPTGGIAWFDALRCPAGWAQYAAATGRALVPVGPSGPLGGVWQDGVPLGGGQAHAHAHTVSGVVSIGSQRFVGVAGGGNGLAAAGEVVVAGTTDAATLGLPYVQLLACEKTSDQVMGRAPAGVFVFAAEALGCGADWRPSDEGSDRLLVGVPDGGAAGGTFGAPAGLATRPSHSHPVIGNLPIDAHGVALASGCCSADFASSSDPHFDLQSGPPVSSDEAVFPWRAELQCLAPDGDLPAPIEDAAPPGIVVFSASDICPLGWSAFELARGRLVIGAATGGDVGLTFGVPLADREDRQHQHRVTLGLTLAQKNIAAANGPNQDGAAPGPHDGSFITGPASSGLPFRQLLACRKP